MQGGGGRASPDNVDESYRDPDTIARGYQLEALEKAKKENTIVFLETGSGKTLIAVMLLKSYAHMIRKPSQHIAVFLAPAVHLVSQQADVLEMHTDLKVGRFWGEMGVDFWSESTWNQKLQEFEVFVMTPAILLNNLQHSFFKIGIIKLLILDECHNARGKSPYACIMREYYHPQLGLNSGNLPRILGMTASLVNDKGSSSQIAYKKKISEIETLLNSKVYTVDNESVLAQYVPFPTPKIKFYKHVDASFDQYSHLACNLKLLKLKYSRALQELGLDGLSEEGAKRRISKLHGTFSYCLSELGIWMTIKAAEALSCRENDIFFWGEDKDHITDRIVREFSKDVFKDFSKHLPPEWHVGRDLEADLDAGFLSSKIECLLRSLIEYGGVKDLRCIIFVERVITAIVLQSLLSQVQELLHWKTKYTAGNHSGLQCQSRREQINIVDAFREGKVNIIVATQILEEGLDVQGCNLVIRFDPSTSVCSFIQSRGRARMQGSDYILIVKSGDSSTLSRVMNYLASGDIMRKESLGQASLPCAPLDNQMLDEECYCVESTGAIVTLSSSVTLIYFYCSRLPSDGYFKSSPRFVFDKEYNICSLYLPKSCPLQHICVEGHGKMLKQIACLEACKRLHQIGALTDNLLPEFGVESEATIQEINDFPRSVEHVNFFPGELMDSWQSFSAMGSYYCYRVHMNRNYEYDISFSDILLVVKSDLGSDFTSVELFLQTDRGEISVNVEYDGVIHLSAEQVSMARRYQVCILKILMTHDHSKVMDALNGVDQGEHNTITAYLLLPSARGKHSSTIDWACVRSALFSLEVPHSNGMVGCLATKHCSIHSEDHQIRMKNGLWCHCMIKNSIVYTPHSGLMYCVTGILDNLNGNSTLKLRGGNELTYKEYYEERHGIILSHEGESLLAGRHIFPVQNWLHRHPFKKEKDSTNSSVELPPELCVIIMSPLSISTLYSFSFIPSIMHRLESVLLAFGLKKLQLDHYMQNDIPTLMVLEALTTKKCQEAFSLESLETLGDSFLKYAASQQLFRSYPYHHEGLLSAKKDQMVSNIALYKLGCERELPGYIRSKPFDPKNWSIPGEYLGCIGDNKFIFSKAKNIYNKGTKYIKYKVVSDVAEALIGAYLSTGGEVTALYFLKWLGIEVDFSNKVPDDASFLARPETYININFLESLLNYSFHNPCLLVEALTHGSYLVQDIPRCYQRLEFLGDAALDYLMTVHLYNKYPGLSPGFLTDLRSASVNNSCYAHAAVKVGLNKHILHASAELHRHIKSYLSNFGQSFLGPSYGWDAGTAAPKVLGDVIESLAGAILVDSRYDKDVVWKSIRPLLEPLVSPDTIKYHPVKELEYICRRKSYLHTMSKSHENGVASITAEVEADGAIYRETRTGKNKKEAKALAAEAMLKFLKDGHLSSLL